MGTFLLLYAFAAVLLFSSCLVFYTISLMPQELYVLCCYSCKKFQVQIVKKIPKWKCNVCNEKQSVTKVFAQGSGKECRQYVQQLNLTQGILHEDTFPEHFGDSLKHSDAFPICNVTTHDTNTTSKWTMFLDNNCTQESDDENCEKISSKSTSEEKMMQQNVQLPASPQVMSNIYSEKNVPLTSTSFSSVSLPVKRKSTDTFNEGMTLSKKANTAQRLEPDIMNKSVCLKAACTKVRSTTEPQFQCRKPNQSKWNEYLENGTSPLKCSVNCLMGTASKETELQKLSQEEIGLQNKEDTQNSSSSVSSRKNCQFTIKEKIPGNLATLGSKFSPQNASVQSFFDSYLDTDLDVLFAL